MVLLIQYTLLFACILSLVALGGCFSEHSGIINLGLEGIMVMGAMGGALAMRYLPISTNGFVVVVVTILASILVGLIYSALLGVAAIPFWKFLPQHTPLALVFMRTMFSLFFVYLGHFYVKYIKDSHDIFTPKWLGIVILIQSALWLFNRDFDPVHGIGLSFVLVWGRFDQQIIVPVLTSITGIWISLLAVKLLYPYLKDVKLLQQMGKVTFHIMANHLLLMYLITLVLFKITGTPLTEKGDKIYSIFNPVQTTYLYFVVVMLVTTYLGVFQQFVWKKFTTAISTKLQHKDT